MHRHYGVQRNYKSAFHKTSHVPWTGAFIYYGEATVLPSATGFQLTSTQAMPAPYPVARILVNCNVAAPVNKMEQRTVDVLSDAVRTGASVECYAYGTLALMPPAPSMSWL